VNSNNTNRLNSESRHPGISPRQPRASIYAAATCAGLLLAFIGMLAPSAYADFGILPGAAGFTAAAENADGSAVTQAGSHPYAFTTNLNFNETTIEGEFAPDGDVRDAHVSLPPGLIGNPEVITKCTQAQFASTPELSHQRGANYTRCPDSSAIGVAAVHLSGFQPGTKFPIFNLVAPPGVPAEFGFNIINTPIPLTPHIRDDGTYGLTVDSLNTSQTLAVFGAKITIWGTPYDASHDGERGGCVGTTATCPVSGVAKPYLTLPTSCPGSFVTKVAADSWQASGVYLPDGEPDLSDPRWMAAEAVAPALDGCNKVPFSPTIRAEPTTDRASAPSGLDFNLDFHDEGLTNAEGIAQSHLKTTVVTLPEGLTINPSAGVGLGGCTAADYANETLSSAPGAGCPNDSKLGTVEVTTPLLATPVDGSLFIAQPYENPFGSLVALYIVLKDPQTGVLIKLAGKVTPNPVTGQLTATFENNPQLPFEHFNFHFREGQQAPLISPPTCGTYSTQAQLTPWSDLSKVLTDVSSFTITKGYDGGPCPVGGVPPFHPGIQSGMINNKAGAFSSFYLDLTRTDAEQEISGFSTTLPPGLTGDLSGIPFCPEASIALARTKTGAAEEASPSCPAASQVGHTLVGTGVGAVLAYVPGKIYLAGPYDGAPFSLVAVTSAVVGPFDLGTVVLRFGLKIDPYTAQVSVDPTAAEPIPTIIQGIVTHVRDIRVYIDRQHFTLNPTSCNPMAITSTLTSSSGQSATVTSPFQDASCASLKFQPTFKVATSGKPSRANGASLTVKLTYPSGSMGTEANIAKVKVELPKQLPSRLTTLQKACTAAQFATNPAGCPAASIVGHAKAVTPILPVPLEGPAYFVSHGGEAFPSLIVVLQGDGVTLDLVGSTFISKAGITSSTFKTVPDAPVGSFELTLPQGPFSALAANGNLCAPTRTVLVKKKVTVKVKGRKRTVTRKVAKKLAGSLVMPTEFVAQNGAQIHQSTPISVTGCSKAKKVAPRKKRK
jgi:hypothetical protein